MTLPIVVGTTGATGVVYGVELLKALKDLAIPIHLPLHLGHLRLMTRAAEIGAIILPPMPAFYHRPETQGDLIRQNVGRTLDQFGIAHDLCRRWSGP